MKRGRFLLLVLPIFSLFLERSNAQIIGDVDVVGTAEINICNCEAGDPIPNQGFGGSSVAVAPNGNVYSTVDFDLYFYDIVTGTNNFVATMPGEPVGLVYGADGLLYTTVTFGISGVNDQLITIDPVSGIVTVLGDMPANWTMAGDCFFYNGILYGWFIDDPMVSSTFLAEINIVNPSASTVVYTYTNWLGQVASVSVFINGVETVLVNGVDITTGEEGLFTFDMNTGAYTLLCPGLFMSDAGAPPGYVVPPCCENDAGDFANYDLITACINQTIDPDHLGDEVLMSGSSLSFILTDSPTGVLPASVIQTLATPSFVFDPAIMSTNTTYYIAAVAAPGPPGMPDWTNDCIDVSDFVPIIWKPLPTVQLASTPMDI